MRYDFLSPTIADFARVQKNPGFYHLGKQEYLPDWETHLKQGLSRPTEKPVK